MDKNVVFYQSWQKITLFLKVRDVDEFDLPGLVHNKLGRFFRKVFGSKDLLRVNYFANRIALVVALFVRAILR